MCPAMCVFVLQGAAGVDDEDDAGLTPLHTCAELGATSLAELLLEKGANLNHAGVWGGGRGGSGGREVCMCVGVLAGGGCRCVCLFEKGKGGVMVWNKRPGVVCEAGAGASCLLEWVNLKWRPSPPQA